MEHEGETRINRVRLAQLQGSGAEQVAVACPFCMIMLEDARGALGAKDLAIRHVAETVADGLVAG
jgi:Fe-S oxidoreductase